MAIPQISSPPRSLPSPMGSTPMSSVPMMPPAATTSPFDVSQASSIHRPVNMSSPATYQVPSSQPPAVNLFGRSEHPEPTSVRSGNGREEDLGSIVNSMLRTIESQAKCIDGLEQKFISHKEEYRQQIDALQKAMGERSMQVDGLQRRSHEAECMAREAHQQVQHLHSLQEIATRDVGQLKTESATHFRQLERATQLETRVEEINRVIVSKVDRETFNKTNDTLSGSLTQIQRDILASEQRAHGQLQEATMALESRINTVDGKLNDLDSHLSSTQDDVRVGFSNIEQTRTADATNLQNIVHDLRSSSETQQQTLRSQIDDHLVRIEKDLSHRLLETEDRIRAADQAGEHRHQHISTQMETTRSEMNELARGSQRHATDSVKLLREEVAETVRGVENRVAHNENHIDTLNGHLNSHVDSTKHQIEDLASKQGRMDENFSAHLQSLVGEAEQVRSDVGINREKAQALHQSINSLTLHIEDLIPKMAQKCDLDKLARDLKDTVVHFSKDMESQSAKLKSHSQSGLEELGARVRRDLDPIEEDLKTLHECLCNLLTSAITRGDLSLLFQELRGSLGPCVGGNLSVGSAGTGRPPSSLMGKM